AGIVLLERLTRRRRYCAFFHADDGIRVLIVTGVETCALPIWRPKTPAGGLSVALGLLPTDRFGPWGGLAAGAVVNVAAQSGDLRSEERRVGKERRCGLRGLWAAKS